MITSSPLSIQLPEETANRIRQLIQECKLVPGDRLPSERDLCARFSVSRPVVREALSRLNSEGLVLIKRGVGVYVSERDPRGAFRIEDFAIEEKISITQVMELISTVEVAATRLAATRRSSEDLKQMRKCLLGMEYAIASDRLGDEEDYEFHQAIVLATQNPYFESLSQHLEHTARRMIRALRSNTKTRHKNQIDAVQAEHQAEAEQRVERAVDQAEQHLPEYHLGRYPKNRRHFLPPDYS